LERWAHARFAVIRINRWSVALVILVVLALLLLPSRSFRPASAPPGAIAGARVKQGVILMGRDFSGRAEEEAREMLKEMGFEAAPMAAREERKEGVSYVIPEVNGYTLDEDQTWLRLATAGEGSLVEPVVRVHTPTRRLSDYPQAIIRQGNPSKQAVALLINVDWGTKELTEMLPVLKRRGVKVTFFVSGRWADGNKRLLKEMAEDGHEIATHGYNLQFGPSDLARAGKLSEDIAKSVAAIEKITGTKISYYAPHKSEAEPVIVKTARDLKLTTVLYSLDTVDWMESTTGERILGTMGKAMPGDLILMHPKPNTARVLEKALIALAAKGLHPVTLSDMLSPAPDSAASWRGQHGH
jgi:peptidoglycan-N-acetylglucosamine deacetylase